MDLAYFYGRDLSPDGQRLTYATAMELRQAQGECWMCPPPSAGVALGQDNVMVGGVALRTRRRTSLTPLVSRQATQSSTNGAPA